MAAAAAMFPWKLINIWWFVIQLAPPPIDRRPGSHSIVAGNNTTRNNSDMMLDFVTLAAPGTAIVHCSATEPVSVAVM